MPKHRARSVSVYLKHSSANASWLWKPDERVDPSSHRDGEQLHILGRIIRRAECVADLLIAQAREQISDPSRVRERDAVNQFLALAAVMQVNVVTLYLIDKLCVCEVGRLVAGPGGQPAGLAERGAQVAHDVTKLALSGLLIVDHNDFVVSVLEVPIVQQHHHYLETMQLAAAEERIVGPLPLRET